MSGEKSLLNNLILCKKNIKRKVMDIKRNVIESDNYFRETFKPILEPLNMLSKKNVTNVSNDSSTDHINTEVHYSSDQEDDDALLNTKFNNFFNTRPQSRRYDKSYGLHYDRANDQLKISNFPVSFSHGNLHLLDSYYPWTIGLWSLLCEKEPKNTTIEDMEAYYDILKTTKVHLKPDGKPKTSRFFKWMNVVRPLYDRMKTEEKQLSAKIANINNSREKTNLNLKPFDDYLVSVNAKRSKINDNTTIANKSFNFDSTVDSPKFEEPLTDKLFKFSLSPPVKKGSGLYKNVFPNTQLVYYDDPNELVTRLNLLIASQSAGNTGVNNEIISILEELRERNLIV